MSTPVYVGHSGKVVIGSGLIGGFPIASFRVPMATQNHFDFLLERQGADEEMQLIQAVRDRMPNAALVYGDWLEEKGRPLAAKLLREGWIP